MNARPDSPFASIEEAIEAIRQGRMVVVVDDEDRENEGDLTLAAEHVSPEAIAFMATHGRGLICAALEGPCSTASRSRSWSGRTPAPSRRPSA